jgi:hypothetical protein
MGGPHRWAAAQQLDQLASGATATTNRALHPAGILICGVVARECDTPVWLLDRGF